MAPPNTNFPPVRACIFDMDGLLIDSEDVITLSVNQVLERYDRPRFTGPIRARLMGVPDSTNSDLFHDWAKLPISREQFARESGEQMRKNFPDCRPLPGAEKVLSTLSCATSSVTGEKIQLALASSTKTSTYQLKISRPETKALLEIIPADRRILGDDPRVPAGRGKPAPDIYLVTLDALNSSTSQGEKIISSDECLVFEDSVAGVEAARRAGMRVIWVPHPDVALEYRSKLKQVLAGRSGMFTRGNDWQLGEADDGWAETIQSLAEFNYGKYGIQVS